jgi:uncharacterized membrane protein
MTNRHAAQITGVLIALMIIGSFWALLQPAGAERYAIGWGRPVTLFAVPVVAAVGWLVTAILPRIDPRGHNIVRSSQAYGTMWIAGTAMFGLFHANVVAHVVGAKIDDMDAFGIWMDAIGVMLIVTGNVLGKLRWNYTLGIRTPWTLADERVWDKTHRFAGWLFVIAGFVVLGSAFTPLNWTGRFWIMFVMMMAIGVLTVGKSYLLWREQRQASHGDAQ